jgi:hypothetical protein
MELVVRNRGYPTKGGPPVSGLGEGVWLRSVTAMHTAQVSRGDAASNSG